MWDSASAGNKTTTTNTISPSTSRSTSNTCLCPKTHLTRKSMEEIWEGINLSSLNHRNPTATGFPPAADKVLSSNNNSSGYDGVRVLGSSDRVRSDPQSQNQANSGGPDPDPSFLSSFNSPFDALSPSPDPFPSFSKKRASKNDDGSGNCRHNRMIKNRESAARSRARKQAYANGLETEVTRLLEENARLRRQVERYRAAAAAQLPKKQTRRTLTAPF